MLLICYLVGRNVYMFLGPSITPWIIHMPLLWSFELGCIAWRYKWSFSFVLILLGRFGSLLIVCNHLLHSTLFPLFNYGIDGALDRDMVVSFTQVTSSFRCETLA